MFFTVLSLAVLGVGAYLLYKKNERVRNSLRGWAYKIRGEVMDTLEEMKDVTRESYNKLVEETARQYAGLKNVDRRELDEVVQDLKYHWNSIRNQLREGREGYDKKEM